MFCQARKQRQKCNPYSVCHKKNQKALFQSHNRSLYAFCALFFYLQGVPSQPRIFFLPLHKKYFLFVFLGTKCPLFVLITWAQLRPGHTQPAGAGAEVINAHNGHFVPKKKYFFLRRARKKIFWAARENLGN